MKKYSIDTQNILTEEKNKNEVSAMTTEMILEGLCWVQPKVLDKKESGYVSA